MKKTILILFMFLSVLSINAQEPILKILLGDGSYKTYNLNDIQNIQIEIMDMSDNYNMLMYSRDSQTGSHSTSNIDSIKFASGNMLVYHGGLGTQYRVSELDSVVFNMSSHSGSNDVVLISSGTFQMGNTGSYSGYSDEKPVRTVTLTNSFYMAKYEVTQAIFKEVMNGYNPSNWKGDSLPVERVCWFEAVDFCNKLSDKDGLSRCYTINMNGASSLCDSSVTVTCDWSKKGWRLPTEAEWEYACKAGTTTDFYNGQLTNNVCFPLDNNLNTAGWYCGNSNNMTHNVGGKISNSWGLYDMHGNVWEWCWDWYNSNYGGAMTDPKGPSIGTYRVLRGGSWFLNATNCRSANRDIHFPSSRDDFFGFRICRYN